MSACQRIMVTALFAVLPTLTASADDKWLEVRSPNFTVISNAGEKEAQRVAYELEVIRATLGRAAGRLRPTSAPSTILWTKDRKIIQKLLPPDAKGRDSSATVVYNREKYYLAMKDLPDPDYGSWGIRTLEFSSSVDKFLVQLYAWRMVRLHYGMLPYWMDSGLGTLFGSTVFRPDEVRVGIASPFFPMFVRDQKVLPIEKLMTIDRAAARAMNPDKSAALWGQCWATVQFLFFSRDLPMRHSLEEILDRLYDGVESKQAAEEVLGDLGLLQKKFEKYIRQDNLVVMTLPPPPFVNLAQISVRPMTPAAVATVMGDLILTDGRPKEALPLLEEAVRLDPEFQPAQAAMGWLRFKNNERAAAIPLLEKAIANAPSDYLAKYYLATVLLADPQKATPALQRAATLFRQAIRLAPNFAPSYEGLARALMDLNIEPLAAYENAGFALERDGSVPALYLTFAEASDRIGLADVARQAARRVLIGGRDEKELAEANELMARLGPVGPAPVLTPVPHAHTASSAPPQSAPTPQSSQAGDQSARPELKRRPDNQPASGPSSQSLAAPERPQLKRRPDNQSPALPPSVEGTLAVTCRGFELEIETKTKNDTVRLRTRNLLEVGYFGWPKKSERFDPCTALAGVRAKIAHNNGEIISVDLLN